MSRAPIATAPRRRALNPGVEYEFERLTLSRELSRNVVTRMLTDRAERGGWELDRVRLSPDGTRRVVLRRKIIRQTRLPYLMF
jgi:phage gp46-like protein